MTSSTYRFGDFRLDPANRRLQRGDEDLALPLKVFKCLVYLVEHHDRAVSRDELIEQVWGTVNLTDNVVAQTILQARHALGDTGETQQYIETLRGFGYRWATPVEVEAVEGSEGDTGASPGSRTASTAADARNRVRPIWLWLLSAILILSVLTAGALYLRHSTEPRAPDGPPAPRAEGEIVLLLPVTVEAGTDHAWVRLGVMDLIATRLREAGQAMVPSDTVIALLRGHSPEPAPDELTRLTAATGAHLVLAAQARVTGTRWTVALHSLLGAQPPLTAVGEAHDVLEAARAAADRMVLGLGLTPAAEPSTAPDLQRLLQQIEAARLDQQMDVARVLVESADPVLRRHPEVRFQSARIAFYAHDLDAAEAAFESLLDELAADHNPVLRARVLNGLAAVYLLHADPDAAEPLLNEAVRLLHGEDRMFSYLSNVHINLAIVADMREDCDAARTHYAQVRRILEGSGDVRGLAALDHNVGTLERRRERYAEALRHFESAAERKAAIQDVGGELRARASMIQGYLGLLDPQAASAVEPRVNELLARTANEQLAAYAKISRAYLLDTVGRRRAAERLESQLLSAVESGDIRDTYRMAALLLRAERTMADDSDFARARDLATEVVEGLAGYTSGYEERARAWLLVVRADLALGRPTAAAEASTVMTAWAQGRAARSPKIYAALADAELATAEGRAEAARAAFERAFLLADTGHVPLHLLRVAQSYVPWLLREGPHHPSDLERALFLAERLAAYAEQHYGVALLQLSVYHALGPPSAWRASLARAASLVGERQIPPELQVAPQIARASSDS